MKDLAVEMNVNRALLVGYDFHSIATRITVEVQYGAREEVGVSVDDRRHWIAMIGTESGMRFRSETIRAMFGTIAPQDPAFAIPSTCNRVEVAGQSLLVPEWACDLSDIFPNVGVSGRPRRPATTPTQR
jgi:hypothetical protein